MAKIPRARGETFLENEEQRVDLLFTNYALSEIEAATGQSIIGLANGFSNNTTGVGDMAKALRAGMEAYRRDQRLGGKVTTLIDAFNVLDQFGFTAVANAVMTGIAAVLSHGQDESFEGESPN